MLQLDSYSNARLLKWQWAVPTQRLFEWQSGLVLVGLFGVQVVLWVLLITYGAYAVLGIWAAAGGLLLFRRNPPQAKKALVYTARAVRILVLALLIDLVVAVAFALSAFEQLSPELTLSGVYKATALVLIAGFVTVQLAPLVVVLANLMLAPVQSAINAGYLSSARKRLQQFKPIVVGITGSYGKTSTKYFLDTLLSERYCVLKTPQSFNTLMGICRVINDTLRPEHEVFIVEMGAYRRGDIRVLSDVVHPQIGILTAIGPQHLERFKTLDNIETTKYELIVSLPPSGIAVFNTDDPRCRKLADQTQGVKVLRYGLDHSQPGLRVWGEEISQSAQGQSFTLVDSNGNRAETNTVLMGRHNVLNMLGAACVALELGVSLDDVARTIPKIQPAPHRLQVLQGSGGVTVLDDSYNSNPIGAAEALETLRAFETGKRVLVTPGMIELGEIEAEQNEEFGAQAAKVCDYVLLVGPRQTQAILKGLEREQFPRENIRVVRDLAEATSELQHIVRAGDVVLFENDLPDLYAEA
jgi:UDP-N-acetylmuramoyl-tripeptide--D-alanyl-D-alanine ligase